MTEDPTNPRQALEASLTALLLGELPADQALFLRQAIATDPELARMYARLERTINLVRETATEPAPGPAVHPQLLRLSSERRQQLLQRFKTVDHPVLAKPERRDRSWLVPAAIAATLMLLAGAMLLPALSRAKFKGQHAMVQTVASDESTERGMGNLSLANNRSAPVAAPGESTLRLNRERGRPTAPSPSKGTEQAGREIVSGQPGGADSFAVTPPPSIFLPSKLPESESELALTAKALDSAIAGKESSFSLGGGMGGGGAGGAPATPPAENRPLGEHRDTSFTYSAAPAQEEALSRRYGLRLPNSEAKEPEAQAEKPPIAYSAPDRMAGAPVSGNQIYRGISVMTNGRMELQQLGPRNELTPRETAQWQAPNTLSAQSERPPSNLSYAAGAAQGTAPAIDPTTGLPNALSDEERARAIEHLPMFSREARKPAGEGRNAANLGGIVQPAWSDKERQKNGGVLKVDGSSQLADNKDRRLSDLDALYKAPATAPAEKPMFGDTLVAGALFQPEVNGKPVDKLQEEDTVNESIAGLVMPPAREPGKDAEPMDGFARAGASTSTNYPSWQFSAVPSETIGKGTFNFWNTTPAPAAQSQLAQASLPAMDTAGERAAAEQMKRAGGQPKAFSANLRGFYDDSLAASNGADNARLYADAKTKLEQLQHFDQVLQTKVAGEKTDLQLPKNSMVEIVDSAVVGPVESPSLGKKLSGLFSSTVERKARVKVERDQSDVSGVSLGVNEKQVPAAYDPHYVQMQVEAIQSDAVLGAVVDKLKLDEAWAKKRGTSTPLPKSEAVKMLKEKLEVKSVGKTDVLDIGVKSDKPEEAANLANAVAQSYRDRRLEQRKELARAEIASLQDHLAENEQRIREAQTNVDYLREKYKVSDYMAGGNAPTVLMTAETLRRIKQLRMESEAELVRKQTLLNQLNSMRNDPDALAQALPGSGIQDQGLGTLREQRVLAEQQLASLKAQYGAENAQTMKVAAQVDDLKSKINDRVAGVISGLETQVTSLGQNLTNLQMEVAKATRSDLDKASQTQLYWEAKARLEQLQRARTNMTDKSDDARPPKPATPPPEPQPEIQARDNAFSTFSLNVSDVSFKLAAASLEKGVLPEPASIRSEEFINAFDYRDPEPAPGAPIAFAWERARYPFAQNRDLLRFSLKTAALGRQAGRQLNLVLVLDNSGSMERADRVSIIHEALRVLATQLQPNDTLSVVLFARTPRLWVDGARGNEAGKFADEVSGLTPEGGTNLGDALDLAYQTALRHYLPAGINRVVVLTDGAANLGNVEPQELKKKVEANRRQGVALDCFGIGWEGYNDDLLEVLTRNGDGRYGFINSPEEAATEFAGQLAGALHVAASDVKVQVEFNPKRVTAYRQIGYAKHQLTKEQFRDSSVDAAELGAAESGNALYVVDVNGGGDGPLATVRVRYKVPGTMQYQEQEWTVPYTASAAPLEQASPALRLAASASAFSEWLATSPYAAEVTPDSVLGYLRGVPEIYGADARPKKLEWMVRQAKSLVGK